MINLGKMVNIMQEIPWNIKNYKFVCQYKSLGGNKSWCMWNVNSNRQTELKTAMFRSIVCNYSDAHILVKGTMAVVGAAAADRQDKKEIFKNSALFTDYVNK